MLKTYKNLLAIFASVLIAIVPAGSALAADPVNLINNPSVETIAGTNPDGWLTSNWGTNQATFSLDAAGHTGAHSLKTEVTAYTDGAANWYSDAIVTPGATYQYSQWYKSNVDTQIEVETINSEGTRTWNSVLGVAPASADWVEFKTTYTVPVNVTGISIYQPLNKVGIVISDDFSLTAYTPVGFNHPIVSITFDDGWTNQFDNARPVMQSNGLVGTYYIISGDLSVQPDYMTAEQVKTLFADGNEIASHTMYHCNLAPAASSTNDDPAHCNIPLQAGDLEREMSQSKLDLTTSIGAPITNFAYPYGAYNADTIAKGIQVGYTSQRTVDRGYNTKDNLNLTKLKIYEVDSNNTTEEVKGWVDGAIRDNSWLILVYHEVSLTPAVGDELYTVTPSDFANQMAYIKDRILNSNLTNKTVAGAIADIGGTSAVKPGDVNGDNVVDALDLSTLLVNWNKAGATKSQGDLNLDGIIDALDLSTLLVNWSK